MESSSVGVKVTLELWGMETLKQDTNPVRFNFSALFMKVPLRLRVFSVERITRLCLKNLESFTLGELEKSVRLEALTDSMNTCPN